MNRPIWQRRLILAGKIGMAGGLLAWLTLSGRLQFDQLASIRVSWDLGLLIVLILGAAVLPIARWWLLLRVQHLHEPFWKVLVLTWTTFFVGQILPGAASGDAAKAYLILRRRPGAKARALSTVLADRFLGLYSLLFLGCATIALLAFQNALERSVQVMAITIAGILLGMTCAAACLMFVSTRKIILRILPGPWREAWNQSFEFYWVSRQSLVGCFVLSIASSAMTFASFAVAGKVIGENISWLASFMAGPLIVLANCLPLTPGGIGTGEAASSELFTCFGSSHGAEVMILVRMVGVLVSVPGVAGLWFLPTPKDRDDLAQHTAPLVPTPPIEDELNCLELYCSTMNGTTADRSTCRF